MEWTRKHKNLTSANNNSVLKCSREKEITVLQKTNASEDCDSAEIYQPQINSENLEINYSQFAWTVDTSGDRPVVSDAREWINS